MHISERIACEIKVIAEGDEGLYDWMVKTGQARVIKTRVTQCILSNSRNAIAKSANVQNTCQYALMSQSPGNGNRSHTYYDPSYPDITPANCDPHSNSAS